MKPLFYIFVLALVLFSCEDVIDLNIENNASYIVVDGEISDLPGEKITRLYYNNAYFDSTDPEYIINAEVVLYENGISMDTMIEISPGHYATSYTGVKGNAYHISFSVGENTYESVPETINRVSEIDSMYANFIDDSPFLDPGYYVFFDTFEPSGPGDYYRWRTYYNNTYLDDPFNIFVSDDQLVDGNPIDEFQVNFEPYNAGDTVRVEQMSITKTNYEYWSLISTQTAQVGSLFDAPPAPVIGNIVCTTDADELVLGYFSASAIRDAEIIIQP